MKPDTKKFEIKLLRVRDSIERKGIRLIKSAIAEQYREFLAKTENIMPDHWKDITVSDQPIQNFFETFYPMSARIAVMNRNRMLSGKSDDELFLSVFQQKMRDLTKNKQYSDRIRTITETTKDRINSVLSDVMTEAEIEGYGIEKIRQSLQSAIGSAIRGNVTARARAIAQTEMISASNQASTFAADSTGLEYRKFWSTSHLQGIRPTHIMCEQESIQKNGLRPDERFESNGLLFPGDPAGDASEVCNCRCTILHEIV